MEPMVSRIPAVQHHHGTRRLAADLVALSSRTDQSERRLRVPARGRRMGPLSPQEWKSALLIAAAIVLWLTDFIHHIPASVIGIGVGLFALLPLVEILEIEDMRRLNNGRGWHFIRRISARR